MTPGFWTGKRVLLTGHTGFKGAWLALWLENLGAEVFAVALPPASHPNLFDALAPGSRIESIFGDLREPTTARSILAKSQPEFVFHLAAQALVRPAYQDPVATFATNVLGTVHLLEAIRQSPSVKVALVVTSDKVYANDDRRQAFCEDDPLGGHDPYSASKACQEIVVDSYRSSFYSQDSLRIATARAGNVIGGGDWAIDRLIPDFVRAAATKQPVALRLPGSTRPWQHVLDPLAGYLRFVEKLDSGADVPDALNFGPRRSESRSVRWVIERMIARWGDGASWKMDNAPTPPEAPVLEIDSTLATRRLDWLPRLSLESALDWTVDWYRAHERGSDMRAFSLEQIGRYEGLQA